MLLNVQIKNNRLFLSLLVVSHAGIVTFESLSLEPFNLQDCLEAPVTSFATLDENFWRPRFRNSGENLSNSQKL